MSNFPVWFQPGNFDRNLPKDLEYRVLQIGVYTGDATEWLLNNRNVVSIDDVDTWEGSLEHQEGTPGYIDFQGVEEYYDSRFREDARVTKYKMTSDKFFADDRGKSYNFIYIDGDHTALQTAIDGLNAFRLLEQDGVLGFDDYLWDMGQGPEFNPKRGIEGVFHVLDGLLRVQEIDYQAWLRKV